VSPALDRAWAALRRAAESNAAAGAVTLEAEMDAASRELIDCLGPVASAGAGFTIGQIGQSLDGRICTESGDSHYVNGDAALMHLHRLRALVDCVLVGVGTAIADAPRLTVRRVEGRDPVRAVLDPAGRAALDRSPFAAGPDQPATWHLVGRDALDGLAPGAPHVRRLPVTVGPAGVDPHAVLKMLAAEGCGRVLIEGGAATLSRFVAAGALNRLHVLVAPLLIGSGRAGLSLPRAKVGGISAARPL
jgi:riboflavin-specific deaminase-like protein